MGYSQQKVQATENLISYTQPNGKTIKIRLFGDANMKYHSTKDGFLIAKNKKGYFCYLKKDSDGKLTTSCRKANLKAPSFALKADEDNVIQFLNTKENRPN